MKEYRFGKAAVIDEASTYIISYRDNSIDTKIYAASHNGNYYVDVWVITRKMSIRSYDEHTIIKTNSINHTFHGREAEKRYNVIKKTIQFLKQKQQLQVIE